MKLIYPFAYNQYSHFVLPLIGTSLLPIPALPHPNALLTISSVGNGNKMEGLDKTVKLPCKN